jgi:hypothetical protein
MEEMDVSLLGALGQHVSEKFCIQTISKGLDEAYPFNDTYGLDIILQEAEKMLSPSSVPEDMKGKLRKLNRQEPPAEISKNGKKTRS